MSYAQEMRALPPILFLTLACAAQEIRTVQIASGLTVPTDIQNVADAASETVILAVQQPFSNHNGGQVRFGPDGYLYIALGDGGSAGDPFKNGQSLGTLLGKLLRVDVESAPGQVRIPPDNPFVNT